ncbi:LysR substrate-binding domain-containing protein [Pantoea sp. FN0302]|uniref:LysR substrate-binding domain-containing protein n=1 Tax=Pantoea sp. FN0302 TaxID=3418558 RepID=UPI003CE99F14
MTVSKKNILPLPSLKNILAFIEVANTGSLNSAAENLNVTASAVSHQIAALESFLGKKLFTRNGKGVVLTLTGEVYLKEIAGPLTLIGRATEKAIHDIHHEHLRVHSSPSFGLLWLMKRLDKFRQAHPDIQLNLTCSYENLQFARDNLDIDIRHGLAEWPTLNVKTIKNEKMVVLASPEYLARHPITHPEQLVVNELINSEITLIGWDVWFSWHGVEYKNKNFVFSFDRSYMSFEAACMNMGFILESDLLAQEYIQAGKLKPVFNDSFAMPVSAHHLVYPHVSEKKEKMQRFLGWLEHELQASGFHL